MRNSIDIRKAKLAKLIELGVNTKDLETQSILARYCCLQVSGYVENTVKALIIDLSSNKKSPKEVCRFVEHHVKPLTNLKYRKLYVTIQLLDPEWANRLDNKLDEKEKAALSSVVELRNKISHGHDVTLTMSQLKQYWDSIQIACETLTNILAKPKVRK